ncbi:major capsid protein [Tortoise microvirus 71]|nr:major capsid protein [Tortoise microvirus 71]
MSKSRWIGGVRALNEACNERDPGHAEEAEEQERGNVFSESNHETASLQSMCAASCRDFTSMEESEKKMKNVNRRKTTPLKYPRSRRNHPVMHLSSTKPGYAHPVQFIPMLREDALVGQINATVEMLETKEILMNGVTARFTAWVVPFLAFERFAGSRDEFDRSYMGENSLDGTGVTPFMDNAALPVGGASAWPILRAAGLHGKAGQLVSTAYTEAYNLVYNHRARQASKDLTPRALFDTNLAPAFWNHMQFPHMVADFDQAMIDGQVALNVIDRNVKVHGIGAAAVGSTHANVPVNEHGVTTMYTQAKVFDASVGSVGQFFAKMDPTNTFPEIYAEMTDRGITVSLAGLEEARKLQSFAKLRTQFEGHDDDYIIDMLMQGLTVPDQHLKQPFQIADQTVKFSQGKRYATDSGNLDDSATSGFARASLRLRVPRINTGGVVVVLMEVLPIQLWERQEDWFLHTRPKAGRAGHDYWPDAERDTLDREKVDVVYNGNIDVSHSDPNGYFAYEPMNAKYNRAPPTIGGKFYRPAADAPTDDARKRLWAVEGVDPKLTDSFFIAKPGSVHLKPFLDEVNDPFEVAAQGNCVIDGNTQFGGLLIEQTGNYEAVAEKAPTDQIVKEPAE